MPTLHLLHLNDAERDAAEVLQFIQTGDYDVEHRRVDSVEAVVRAIPDQAWDLILVRCRPRGCDALGLLQALQQLAAGIPVIAVVESSGDDLAAGLIQAGVSDVVMKEDLVGLWPAMERALQASGRPASRGIAETPLRDRARMLRTGQRIARLGGWEHDLRTGRIVLSDEVFTIIGRAREKVESLHYTDFYDFVHPADRGYVVPAAEAVIEDGGSQRFECRIVRPDGEVRWIDAQLDAERDADGSPVRLVGAVLDITDRKLAESELQFQAKLLAAAEQAIIATDLAGRTIFWNTFAERLYGWRADEALGEPIFELIGSESAVPEYAAIWDQLRRGASWSNDVLVRHRDGHTIWAHVSNSPVHDAEGELIGVIGISYDVTERRQAAEALRESEQNYRILLEQAADGIVVVDHDRHISTVNTRACEMFGFQPDEFTGRELISFFHPTEVATNPPRIAEVQSGATVTNERLLQRKDGSYFPAETSTKILEDGRAQIIIRDITERKAADEALRRSEGEYRSLFESANDAIIIIGVEDETVIDANPSALRLYGVSREDFVGHNLYDLGRRFAPDLSTEEIHVLTRNAQGMETIVNRSDGTPLHLMVSASPIEFQGQPCLLSIQRDISAQKELEEQLSHQALHDDLTGLANRALFNDRLEHALARARNDENDVAVLLLDLDRFKVINDSLGHEVGDRLLMGVAERLAGCIRDDDTVSRFSGDEFIILLEDVTNFREVTMVAERVNSALQAPFHLDGRDIVVTASTGIVISPQGREAPEDLLRHADVAMYRAKDKGPGQYVVFEHSMNATMIERLQLETDLRKAIARDELRVYFQPLVELATGRVVGMEALVRWLHPTRGLLSPATFIPLAEESGLIRLIDQWVLVHACRQIAAWQRRYPEYRVTLNVNLSAQGVEHPHLVQEVADALDASGMDAQLLQLEITESVIMTDVGAAHVRLRALKELGVRIAIDDFGTGYSSLSYLKRFPVDTLKVDKSFVGELGLDDEDTVIVQAVISLARALGLNVVAEGVESQPVVSLLQQLGCDLGQGYLFAEPLPAETLENLWDDELRIDTDWRARKAS